MSDEQRSVASKAEAALDAASGCDFAAVENRLSSGPLVLAVLGHLSLLAAESTDFSLVGDGNNKFTRLQLPTSYRACLQQVCNETSAALLKAQGNMAAIGMIMASMPVQMKDVLDLLMSGTPEDIDALLPIDLEEVQENAKVSKEKAKEVVDKFNEVIQTLCELTQGAQGARGGSEEAKREAELKAKMAKADSEEFEDELKQYQDEMDALVKKLETEEQELKAELDRAGSMADLGKQALLKLTDDVLPMATMAGGLAFVSSNMSNVESGFATLGLLGKEAMKSNLVGQIKSAVGAGGESRNLSRDKRLVARGEAMIKRVILVLKKGFNADGTLDRLALKNDNIVREVEEALKGEQKKLDKLAMEASLDATTLDEVHRSLANLTELIKDAETSEDSSNDGQLHSTLVSLENDCHEFLRLQKEALANNAGESIADKGGNDEKTNAGMLESHLRQQFEVMQIRKAKLASTEAKAQELKSKEREKKKERRKTLHDMSTFEEKSATAIEVLKAINKGLEALAEFKEHWEQLLTYFTHIDNLVQLSLGGHLRNFVKTSKAAIKVGDKDISDGFRQRLCNLACQASLTTAQVGQLAITYEEISVQHLQPMMSTFNRYLAFDSQMDQTKIQRCKLELEAKALEAQDDISRIVEKGRKKLTNDLKSISANANKALENK